MSWKVAVCAILLLSQAAWSEAQPIGIQSGKAVFAEVCNRCHPLEGPGPDKIAPRLRPMTLFEFGAGIWNQSHSMFQAFESSGTLPPHLTRQEMAGVFLLTQIVGDDVERGDAEAGQRLVRANGCTTCHQLSSPSDGVARSLDSYANMVHPTTLVSRLWSHRGAMVSLFRAKELPLPRFRKGDLLDLAAYIRSVGALQSASPILLNEELIVVDATALSKFQCDRCHDVERFLGRPSVTTSEIAESLLDHAFMPEFERPPLNRLAPTPEEMVSLSVLVYYLGHLEVPGDPATGERVFRQRQCTECHDLPGRVDMESERVPIGSVEDEWDFITRIFNKVPLMIKKARVESRAFPRLSPMEMRHLFAFICASSKSCSPLLGALGVGDRSTIVAPEGMLEPARSLAQTRREL